MEGLSQKDLWVWLLSGGVNAMGTHKKPTKLQAWPEKYRRNTNKWRLSDSPPPKKKKSSNAWKQDDELLNCKHVLLFIKRKDDSEGETKYPEDRTKSHQELFSLYKQIKKVSSASWIRKLLCTSDSFLPSISFLNQNMYSYNPRLSHYVCGEC